MTFARSAALVTSAVMIITLAMPPTAVSQATLLTSDPKTGARIRTPTRLSLRFDRPIVRAGSAVMLVGPKQRTFPLSRAQAEDARTLVYLLPSLAPGDYEAHWKVAAAPEEYSDGVIRLTVISRD